MRYLSRGARNIAKFDIQGLGKLEKVLDGGFDSDTIVMGDEGEALFLHDALADFYPDDGLNLQLDSKGLESTARILSVEEIYAGGGDDLLDFSSIAFRQNGLTLQGGDGDDIIWGGDLEDVIEGGSGNDVINGGVGNDVLTGGSGVDRFEFTITSGNDVITDFVKGEDKLEFYLRDGFGEDEVDAIPTLAGNAVLIGEYQVDINVQGGTLDESDYAIFWI
jgi:Ca2+-binding RTX toxin-like protein